MKMPPKMREKNYFGLIGYPLKVVVIDPMVLWDDCNHCNQHNCNNIKYEVIFFHYNILIICYEVTIINLPR